jgi:hypothetical protein
MSPEAGSMLLNEVAPRIRSVTAHFKFVGSEDQEEVAQDAIALAAKLLHNTEINHKQVTAGNIAYYSWPEDPSASLPSFTRASFLSEREDQIHADVCIGVASRDWGCLVFADECTQWTHDAQI